MLRIASCYPHIVNLGKYAGFQSEINTIHAIFFGNISLTYKRDFPIHNSSETSSYQKNQRMWYAIIIFDNIGSLSEAVFSAGQSEKSVSTYGILNGSLSEAEYTRTGYVQDYKVNYESEGSLTILSNILIIF